MENTNNTKSETKPKQKDQKKKKPTKKTKMDISSIIFYSIMVIGLIIFVVIMIIKSNKQHYVTYFGEDIKVTIDLKKDDFTLSIYADSDEPSVQTGKYKKVDTTETDTATNTDSKIAMYSVEFDDGTKAEFTIDEKNGTLKLMMPNYSLEFKKGE